MIAFDAIVDAARRLLKSTLSAGERMSDVLGDNPNAPPLCILRDGQGGERLEFPAAAIAYMDARAEGPRRRRGTALHSELGSFCAHVDRFKSEATAIWADASERVVRAVFDYHPAGPDVASTLWCEHEAIYACPVSAAWELWRSLEGESLSQERFADLVEDRLSDLTSGAKGSGYPQPAAVLELARDLKVHVEGRFERKINPTTGEESMICKTEHSSSSTAIPRAFLLAIPVMQGGDLYEVEARIRFKVRDGRASFSYQLHRADELERSSFSDVATKAAKATGVPLFFGRHE